MTANSHQEVVGRANLPSFYLPDFNSTAAIFSLLLILEAVAVGLSAVRVEAWAGFFPDLAKTSVLMLWFGVSAAAVLSWSRPVLLPLRPLRAGCFALLLIMSCVSGLSEAVYWFGQNFGDASLPGPAGMFPETLGAFFTRNLVLSTIVGALMLRYFYVTHQWRDNVEKEATSRISALQARIRPHFLFNSMNTIAALIPTNPIAAEAAVEDLADLFRAALSNPGQPISLEQELEVARVYERMEKQRLGERLRVDWQLEHVPMTIRIPGLTIQPLLENAIYHGIEPLPEGGVVTICASCDADRLKISISNPLGDQVARGVGSGQHLALDNIRQRLQLAYGRLARLDILESDSTYKVEVSFPIAA